MSETNTIDELMEIDPLSLTADNIDQIIAHHRKARQNAAQGIKAKKERGPSVDISSVMANLTGAAPTAGTPTVRRR